MPHVALAELEQSLRAFDPEKRQETLRAITDLFLSTAPELDEAGVEVFDSVYDAALEKQNVTALVDISERMAPVPNAPSRLIKRLAGDAEIAVAGPVLRQSPRLGEADLCEIAGLRGNAHLLAISTRENLTSPVTDILIDRGDNDVARNVASNQSADLSERGVAQLVERSRQDETIGVGLYARSNGKSEVLRAELARRESQAEDAKARIAAAQRSALTLMQTGEAAEPKIRDLAAQGKYEELIAMVSLMSKMSFHSIENMMHGSRLGGLTIVCKSLGFSMTTMNAVWKLATSRNGATAREIQSARKDFLAVSKEIAERVVRFWLVRQSAVSL